MAAGQPDKCEKAQQDRRMFDRPSGCRKRWFKPRYHLWIQRFELLSVVGEKTLRTACKIIVMVAISSTAPAFAGAFWGATVWRVPTGQTLSIRIMPSPTASIRGTSNNGDTISMTGACRRVSNSGATVSAFRIDGPGTSASRYARMKLPRSWCELMHEPTPGNPEIGWARGVFINPN